MMLSSYEKNPGDQPTKLVQLDSRGRLSLQRYTECSFFQLKVENDGTIILVPSVVMPVAVAAKAHFEA